MRKKKKNVNRQLHKKKSGTLMIYKFFKFEYDRCSLKIYANWATIEKKRIKISGRLTTDAISQTYQDSHVQDCIM